MHVCVCECGAGGGGGSGGQGVGRRICKAGFVIVKVSQYAGCYACNGSFKTVTFESLGNSPPISRKRMFGVFWKSLFILS